MFVAPKLTPCETENVKEKYGDFLILFIQMSNYSYEDLNNGSIIK